MELNMKFRKPELFWGEEVGGGGGCVGTSSEEWVNDKGKIWFFIGRCCFLFPLIFTYII